MSRLGRLLVQRIVLIVILLTPGTLTTLTQQAAAEAAATRAVETAIPHQAGTLGQPPESTAQFASTPNPSGAYAPFPDNHSFDATNTSLGSLTTNADFEAASAGAGTVPENYDFEAPIADAGIPPPNGDFENGDLSGWGIAGSVSLQSDPAHGYWAKISSSGSLTSPPISVDPSAQVVSFDLNYINASFAEVYILSGTNYATSTHIGTWYCSSSCGYWATVTIDIHQYAGQSIKLKVAWSWGSIGVDHVRTQRILPGYALNGNITRAVESDGNTYARLSSGTLTSSPFTVDSSAQVASIRIRGWGNSPQYEVDILTGQGFTTSTFLTAGYGNTSQWQTIQLGLGSWAGQQIELKIRVLSPTIGVDDVGLQSTVFPGWQTTGTPYRVDDGAGNHYASINGNLTSAPFTVSTDVQQFSLRA
jgi:hypothetical protein